MKIPIEISARHIHLSKSDLEKLFGKDYALKVKNEISQPGQFSAVETVAIKNNDKKIENIRIVGPIRENTQVEISKTDSIKLGINAPVKISGDIKNTPGISIIGTKSEIGISEGVIIAKRHLHISPIEANSLGLKNHDMVSVKIEGERGLVFDNVSVRSREGVDELALHLDTDEANAAGVEKNSFGEIYE